MECSCIQGFTGKFCEYSEKAQNIFFIQGNQTLLFTEEGSVIGKTSSILDDNIDFIDSCSIMLNGQTIIFGGSKYEKQVLFLCTSFISLSKFRNNEYSF